MLGDSDKAALAGFATTVVVVTALARWDLRKQRFFWAYLLMVSAGHAVIIAEAQISLPTPTKLFAPVVTIDFVLVFSGLFGMERLMRFSRRARPHQAGHPAHRGRPSSNARLPPNANISCGHTRMSALI